MIRQPLTAWALGFAVLGCAGSGREAEREFGRRVEYDHTVRVGDMLPVITTLCDDGSILSIGPESGAQLITISTPGECTTCEPHMTGVDRLERAGRIKVPSFILYWAAHAEAARAATDYRQAYGRPACRDTAGTWFAGSQVTHTPVTALIKDGRILLLDDAPIISEVDETAFLARIDKHLR